MSKFKVSKRNLLLIITALGLLTVSGWGDNLLEFRARQLATSNRVGELKLASALQPFDDRVQSLLADSYLRLQRPDLAIGALEQLPLTEAGERLAELQLDLVRYEEAIKTADSLGSEAGQVIALKAKLEADRGEASCQTGSNSQLAHYLKALCWLLYQESTPADQEKATLTAPERLSTIEGASRSNVLLAQAFYAEGLLRSSQRALDIAADPAGSLGLILQAKIHRSGADYEDAKTALEQAVKIDPGNLEAHQLLADTYQKLGETDKAAKEAALIKKL